MRGPIHRALLGGVVAGLMTAAAWGAPAAARGGAAGIGVTPASAPALPEGWWRTAVFYQVFVRSFADSTSGPLANDGVGDLRGLIERLDELNDGRDETSDDLGVTALWLMPINESDTYHGYDVVDYDRVDREYGSEQDLRDLVAACHARGIRVIVDMVFNHCSHRHAWFRAALAGDAAYRDWFIWADAAPAYRGPWDQRVWHPVRGADRSRAPGAFYYGVFSAEMPDLNYRHPAVTEAIDAVSRRWLVELGVDGFRLDAIRHLVEDGAVQENTPETFAWLAAWRARVRAMKPGAFHVGEVWTDTPTVAKYCDEELDSAFDFDLAYAIVDSVRDGRAAKVRKAAEASWRLFEPGLASTFVRNHDQPRVMTEVGGDAAGADLCATLLMTLPGVPFVYYGEELGMTGPKPDPRIRTPYPWNEGANFGFTGPGAKPWMAFNAESATIHQRGQKADAASRWRHYQRLIALRRAHASLHRGDVTFIETGHEGLLAFTRSAPAMGGVEAEAAVVLVNLSGSPLEAPRVTLPAGGQPGGAAGGAAGGESRWARVTEAALVRGGVADAAAAGGTLEPGAGGAGPTLVVKGPVPARGARVIVISAEAPEAGRDGTGAGGGGEGGGRQGGGR